MNVEQRQLFEETLAADEASLQAQLEALYAQAVPSTPAIGRKAWLYAGSELAGQRAAVAMSLLQSAKLCGHDPWAYLEDVLTRLPMHLNSRIKELLPHSWQPQG